MQKKSDKFLEKIVKKDYNNELEKILEKKNFDENVKSILLSILYKIETAYKDYEKVKQDVETKDEFIKMFLKQIEDNCEEIKVISLKSEDSRILGNKTFLVDKKNRKIICYPIERKLLYCISKISKKDKIIKDDYFLINKTLSNLINVGNCINQVEPMRDFNGYSWTTIPKEMESIQHNIIYQNLRILLGNEFLNDWIYNKEYIIDYMELLRKNLIKKYGKTEGAGIINTLSQLSVLMDVRYNKNAREEIINIKNEVEEKLEKVQDSKKFVEKITKEKMELTKKIKYIDETLNNKNMLQEEYVRRNENLPLEEKIFSIRILSKILEDERGECLEKIEELNNVLSPKKYLKYRKELEEKEKYLILLDEGNIDKEIDKLIIEIQKEFLRCYYTKLERVQTKQEIIKMIYEFRYYCMIPYDDERNIYETKQLQKRIEQIKRILIQKAGEIKAINVFAKDEEVNYQMLKNIFNIRIINLEELSIKVTKEKEDFFVQLFDDNVFEEKTIIANSENINKKDLEIRLNKKVKIFL